MCGGTGKGNASCCCSRPCTRIQMSRRGKPDEGVPPNEFLQQTAGCRRPNMPHRPQTRARLLTGARMVAAGAGAAEGGQRNHQRPRRRPRRPADIPAVRGGRALRAHRAGGARARRRGSPSPNSRAKPPRCGASAGCACTSHWTLDCMRARPVPQRCVVRRDRLLLPVAAVQGPAEVHFPAAAVCALTRCTAGTAGTSGNSTAVPVA